VNPGDAYSITLGEVANALADRHNVTDHLMTGHHRIPWRNETAFSDVEIGSTHGTQIHTNENLARRDARVRKLGQSEGTPR
jgi:hypothetical protein